MMSNIAVDRKYFHNGLNYGNHVGNTAPGLSKVMAFSFIDLVFITTIRYNLIEMMLIAC